MDFPYRQNYNFYPTQYVFISLLTDQNLFQKAEDTSNKGNKQSARGGNLVIPSNESIVIEDSDEDFEKAPTGATKQTNNSMNKPGTSTNTSVGTSTSAGYTDDNPKDDSSKATANAATATNNSGQPNIVMNVTNITINVSPNSSTLGMDNIVCYLKYLSTQGVRGQSA